MASAAENAPSPKMADARSPPAVGTCKKKFSTPAWRTPLSRGCGHSPFVGIVGGAVSPCVAARGEGSREREIGKSVGRHQGTEPPGPQTNWHGQRRGRSRVEPPGTDRSSPELWPSSGNPVLAAGPGSSPRRADLPPFQAFLPELPPLAARATALGEQPELRDGTGWREAAPSVCRAPSGCRGVTTSTGGPRHPHGPAWCPGRLPASQGSQWEGEELAGAPLTEYIAFSSSRALAFLIASASSLSFRNILFPPPKKKKRDPQ